MSSGRHFLELEDFAVERSLERFEQDAIMDSLQHHSTSCSFLTLMCEYRTLVRVHIWLVRRLVLEIITPKHGVSNWCDLFLRCDNHYEYQLISGYHSVFKYLSCLQPIHCRFCVLFMTLLYGNFCLCLAVLVSANVLVNLIMWSLLMVCTRWLRISCASCWKCKHLTICKRKCWRTKLR